MVVLCVPWQGEGGGWLSLTGPASTERKPWLRRVGWLVLIWGASVTALGLLALIFRMIMSLAGLTV